MAPPFSHKTGPSDDDREVVELAAGGDLAAFDLLVSRHRNRVFRYILKYIDDSTAAEDLTQETFIGAYRNLKHFKHDAKFSTWLFAIATNKVRNFLKRAPENRYQFVSDESLNASAALTPPPWQIVEQKNTWLALKKKIDQLPADLREILVMAALEGLSYEEIARIAAIPVGTVKSKLFRAREMLRAEGHDLQGDE